MNTIRWFTLCLSVSSLSWCREIRYPQNPQGTSDAVATPKRAPTERKDKKFLGFTIAPTLSEMTYDELLEAKNKSIASNNNLTTAKYLKQMIISCDNIKERADLIIELADVLFVDEHYDEAKKYYQELEHLYPGSQHLEKAQYRIIICTHKRILSPDRDQTPTQETIDLCKAFLKRDLFTTYTQEIKVILAECTMLLFQSDCDNATFFINHGRYDEAERRIKRLHTDWDDALPDAALPLARLEVQLAALHPTFVPPQEAVALVDSHKPVKKPSVAHRF